MAAMAAGHLLEQQPALSLNRLVRTVKKYSISEVHDAGQTGHAAFPLPNDAAELVHRLRSGDRIPH